MPRIFNPSDQNKESMVKSPQPTGPLDGAVICLSGNLSQPKTVIDNNILKLGGSVEATVSESCTHLVSTPFELEALTSKVLAAISQGLPIVSEEWISACEQAGHLVGTDFYAVQSATASAVAVQAKAMATPSPTTKKTGPLSITKPSPGGGSHGNALHGLTICCSGSLSQIRKAFHKFCSDRGASIALSVTARCTHLVTTECEADNPTRKVLEAMNRQTPVVCEAFIHACLDAGSIVDETPYLLIDHSVTNASNGAGPSTSFSSGNGSITTVSTSKPSKTPKTLVSASSAGARNRNLISTARASGAVVQVTSNARSEAAARLVMLAHKFEPKRLKDPTGWWISEKLDGVRAYWDGSDFYSRNGNQFPCPDWFKVGLPSEPLDGELWCGRRQFRRCLSIVRNRASGNLWEHVTYLVFDVPAIRAEYEQRVETIKSLVKGAKFAEAVGVVLCTGQAHLESDLRQVQKKGGEGLMLRQPKSYYDTGNRSKTLLKVKTQTDEEAIVIGHEGGKGKNAYRLGALTLRTPDGREFSCGSGLTDADRSDPPPIDSVVTFRYTELMDNGYPRFPVFVSPRDEFDWVEYCKTYSAPSKNSFASGELQREHSIMYAAPKLQRSLSQKAEKLEEETKSANLKDDEGEDTEEFDSEDEALNMALIASAKEHATYLVTKGHDEDGENDNGADGGVKALTSADEKMLDDDDGDDLVDTEPQLTPHQTAVDMKKKRKLFESMVDDSDSDDNETPANNTASAKAKDLADTSSKKSKIEDTAATTSTLSPSEEVDLGLSPEELKKLKRLEQGVCISCALLPAAVGHDTCCRSCALGNGCTCSPPLPPTNTGMMASMDGEEEGDEEDDEDYEEEGGVVKSPLTRTRSEKLADETGLDLASARQILSENDQAEGQMS